jgi:hypothetical protein
MMNQTQGIPAPNLVYRGLALLGAPRVCVDQDQLTKIYAAFRNDPDPELLRTAMQRLGQLTENQGPSPLKTIREQAVNSGRSDAVRVVDEALLQQAEAAKLKKAYGAK